MREAPALVADRGAARAPARRSSAHDPVAMDEAQRRLGDRVDVRRRRTTRRSTGADALVVVTDWNEYRHPDFARIKAALTPPVIFDGRNLYDADADARARLHVPLDRAAGGRMRVLITGAAGFLGSHLCDRFLARRARGRRPRQLHHRAARTTSRTCIGHERFEFVRHNISTYTYVAGRARRRAALRVAGEPDRLPRAPDPDAQGRLARHAQRARPRQGEEARGSSSRRRPRSTATRSSIRSPRATGAT